MSAKNRSAADHTFEAIEQAELSADRLNLEDLNEVRLSITADLGRCSMYVRDILELKRGAVVTLDKLAGEMTDIYINDLALAKGEVVVIGDALHVRIGEIVGTGEKESDEEGR